MNIDIKEFIKVVYKDDSFIIVHKIEADSRCVGKNYLKTEAPTAQEFERFLDSIRENMITSVNGVGPRPELEPGKLLGDGGLEMGAAHIKFNTESGFKRGMPAKLLALALLNLPEDTLITGVETYKSMTSPNEGSHFRINLISTYFNDKNEDITPIYNRTVSWCKSQFGKVLRGFDSYNSTDFLRALSKEDA